MAGDIVFRPGTPHLPAMRTGTAARTAIGVLAAAVIPLTGRAQLIQPSDLEYRGAFRLPGPGGAGEATWAWGGHGLAYHPGGDPLGPEDGYPGSLFGLGHDHHQYVSEIGIPEPVISGGKDLADLNTATTLQPFANIRGNLYAGAEPFEIPYAGLEYLPAGSGRTVERLYFGWHQHLQIASSYPTHGWCSLNLAAPNPVGPWYIGNYDTYGTTDYLFAIPQGWADAHAGGRCLATGRMRDGGQGGQGPSIYAIGPWLDGDPPPANARLSAIPLLRYHNVYYGDPYSGPRAMDRYHHSDQWAGAAWLTAGGSGAVIFVGTKGRGDCWYGGPNGEPPPCENQGWWSTYFDGEIIFYDPAELAAVAAGAMQPYEPQPYAVMNIDGFLFRNLSARTHDHFKAAAFDRARGLLYVFEPLADDDKPIVHVWKVQADGRTPTPTVSVKANRATFKRSGEISVTADVAKTGTPCWPFVRIRQPNGKTLYLDQSRGFVAEVAPYLGIKTGPVALPDIPGYPVLQDAQFRDMPTGTYALEGGAVDISTTDINDLKYVGVVSGQALSVEE